LRGIHAVTIGTTVTKRGGNLFAPCAVSIAMEAGKTLLGLVAGGLALIAVAGPARASSSASECLSISSAELSNGLSFDVRNGCDERLACALTWTLTCENASGKATSKAKQQAKFVVGASDTHQLIGSSATCKDGWKIDEVAWGCAATASAR